MSSDLLKALKVAFLYMPEDCEITRNDYSENFDVIVSDKEFVKQVLLSHGVHPEDHYLKVNGKVNLQKKEEDQSK